MPFKWDDATVARLKELRLLGRSAREVGNEIGCSRSAVLGKIGRLKPRIERKIEAYKGGRSKKDRPRSRTSPGYSGVEEFYTPYVPPEPLNPDTMKNCTLLQLTDKSCRFPIGNPKEPGFCFCGNDIGDRGPSYCDHHARIAYSPPSHHRHYIVAKTGF